MQKIESWLLPVGLLAAGVVQVYLTVLAIDSMFLYEVGIFRASPFIRGGALVVLAGVVAHCVKTKGAVRYDGLLLALGAYIVASSITGFFVNGLNYTFGRHLFAATTLGTSYWLGLYFADNIKSAHIWLRWVGYATAAGGVVFIGAAVFSGHLGKPFTSLNISIPILFSLEVALSFRIWWMAAICAAIILSTNLRSGIIGASIITASYLSFRFIRQKSIAAIGAPLLAVFFFVSSTLLILAVEKTFPTIGISERAQRTLEAFDAFSSASSAKENSTTETVTSHRLSQSLAVWDAIKNSHITLFFGGFGNHYTWRYFSDHYAAWAVYTLDQSDMMPTYFLLTGGILFATVLPLLIVSKMVVVYLNMIDNIRLGSLFVLGFGTAMIFGFQPNVPLFWILLGALSRPIRPNKKSEI